MMSEISGTVSDTEFSCLSSVALSNTDFLMQLVKQSFLLQHIQCRNQITIACAAGINLFYSICHFYDLASFRNILLNALSYYTNVCFCNIRTAHAKFSSHFDIRNL